MKLKTAILTIAVAVFAVSSAFAAECPLCVAAEKGDVAEVKRLLDGGANPNATGGTALLTAVWVGHAEVAKVLLSAGANPNAASNSGVTALHAAAARGHSKVAKVLLSAGANPNAADDKSSTVLDFAALLGNAEVVKMLLSAGANAAKYGTTALRLANRGWSRAETQWEAKEYREVVRLLKEAGAKE